jgi:hypothetical protein
MGYVWLEMLAIADRNEGRIKGNSRQIASSLSWISLRNRPSLSWKSIQSALQFMVKRGWILEENGYFLTCNYAEYHPSRGTVKSRAGTEENPPITTFTNITNIPNLTNEPGNKSSVGSRRPRERSAPGSLDGFDALWAVHPGPKGPKSDAVAAYQRIKPPPEALAALKAQVERKAECDRIGVFCPQPPHLHRWITKRRWEDELTPLPAAPMSHAERLAREAREERQP